MNSLEVKARVHVDEEGREYLVSEVWIDGQPLSDFEYFATDLGELLKSASGSGEFAIITCWCGHMGCAGLRKGIRVGRDEGRVLWEVDEPGQARRLEFGVDEYSRAVRSGIDAAEELLQSRPAGGPSLEITPDVNEEALKG